MGKLIEFIVGFAWSIANLFLGYHIVCSIGTRWEIPFLQEANLPFKIYWGSLFALGVVMAPVFAQLGELKVGTKTEMLLTCIMITFCMLLVWLLSFIFNVICY